MKPRCERVCILQKANWHQAGNNVSAPLSGNHDNQKKNKTQSDMPRDSDGGDAQTLNVAYLGPEASFSHQAAIEVFQPSSLPASSIPTSRLQPNLHPLPSFPLIFTAIQRASTSSTVSSPPDTKDIPGYDYAIIPIENSTNGAVVQVLDLLAQCGLDDVALYPDLEVCAEYYLPVHHCFFISSTSSSSRSEGTSRDGDDVIKAVRMLYTHPQVWGQCTRFLSTYCPQNLVERIDVSSTSAAAQLVAREVKSNTTGGGLNAAISSKLAGQRHNLLCLAENIEDEPGKNTTRFFVVRNRKLRHSLRQSMKSLHLRSERNGRYKFLITFTISHTKPGALADALAVFKHYGFNLTSIDTRPSRRRNWQYVFFVECEEATPHAAAADDEASLANILGELGRFTERLHYLGKFLDRLPREDDGGGTD